MKILKYDVTLKSDCTADVAVPGLISLVDVAEQSGRLTLWAMVDPEDGGEWFVPLKILGTGHEGGALKGWRHWKTVHMSNGLVWHVFRRTDSELA